MSLGKTKYDIVKYDVRGDNLLKKNQIKSKLKATDLKKMLKPKSFIFNDKN